MLIIIVGLLCVWLFSWWRTRASLKDLPPKFPGALPFIGHGHILSRGDGKRLWSKLEEMTKHCLENEGVSHIFVGPQLLYLIADPDDYVTIAESCLNKSDFQIKYTKEWVGEGLVTAPASVWRRHQKLLLPAFSQTVTDGFTGVVNSQARRLVATLGEKLKKGPIEPGDYISQSALETNFLTAFGLERNENTVSQMQAYIDAFMSIKRILTKRTLCFWLHSDFAFNLTTMRKKLNEALKVSQDLSNELISRKRAEFENKENFNDHQYKNGKRYRGFMDLILELSSGGLLSDSEIRCQVDTMMVAGFDTIASAVTISCFMLGFHPDVQDKVHKELQDAFGDKDRDFKREDLRKLEYLDAFIKEVGRLYPSFPIISRYIQQEIKLKNYTVPAGSSCTIFLAGVGRHKSWGPDREVFRPERWLDATTLPKLALASRGFSTGRRSCIGKLYAIHYLKITLAHLIRNFKVTADHRNLILSFDFFLKPTEGCYLTFERRTLTA